MHVLKVYRLRTWDREMVFKNVAFPNMEHAKTYKIMNTENVSIYAGLRYTYLAQRVRHRECAPQTDFRQIEQNRTKERR